MHRPTARRTPRRPVITAPRHFFAAAVLLCLSPTAVGAQLVWGGHAAYAADAFDGAHGGGLRGGFDLPALPFDILGSAEYISGECPPDVSGCRLLGLTLDANFRMVFPVVRPYLTAGLAVRRFEEGLTEETDTGVAAGVGADVGLGAVRVFGETRYEFIDAPEKQFVFRVGLLFGG